MFDRYWGLDFETFSSVDLPKKGLTNYLASPDFQVTVACVDTGTEKHKFDFVMDASAPAWFEQLINEMPEDIIIVAHNAGFERRVLKKLGFENLDHRVVDSAVMARLLGAGSKLEVASRQLADTHKLTVGSDLIKKFAIPHEEMKKPNATYCSLNLEDWNLFIEYCMDDATGGREIVINGLQLLADLNATHIWWNEVENELLTFKMNENGWKVDRDIVEWMKNRAWANSEIAKADFIQRVGDDLNFKSPQQLKKFCADRGVTYKSLDKYHAPVVLEKTQERLDAATDPQVKQDLQDVITMLEIKLEIGGSTLSKLPTILDQIDDNDILKDTYIHLGAGQTFRTTSTKVQMQNIARLDKDIRDIDTIRDYSVPWSNGDMAGQLRQVFTASHPDGEFFVGDFSAVESRGLAYLAGEGWKLDVYKKGLDIYKVLVTKYNGIEYDEVTTEMRPKGKYTELSCGYEASGRAVKDVMIKYMVDISVETAAEWVADWRKANPNIVEFWKELSNLLKATLASRAPRQTTIQASGVRIEMIPFSLPSVTKINPSAQSICIKMYMPGEKLPRVVRFFHGCYLLGHGVAYYKPAEGLYGDKPLWSNINATATQKANQGLPKGAKKKQVLNSIFGGKLAGVLTQSFCRELFFDSLAILDARLADVPNVKIVGQFHDEIGVDWVPGAMSKEELQEHMEYAMSFTTVQNFPLEADIKSAYRYIK